MAIDPHSRSLAEEVINSSTHGFGLVLSLAGSIILINRVASQPDAWRQVGCGVYAAALVAVYAASTLSHAVTRPAWRHAFRILDQSCIYLLIAGTYTPFALEYARFGWWWLYFGLMWTAALLGFVSKLLFRHRIDAVTVWSYLLLGWLPTIPALAYLHLVPAGALLLIVLGGLCYTAGTAFLVHDHRHITFHGIWHLFVIAGSGCHFMAVFLFVAGTPLKVNESRPREIPKAASVRFGGQPLPPLISTTTGCTQSSSPLQLSVAPCAWAAAPRLCRCLPQWQQGPPR